MTARELIDAAISEVAMHRHPNIGEAQDLLHDILQAAGLGGIAYANINSISEDTTYIHVSVSWSARSCEQEETRSFPSAVLYADDPVKAAKIWGLNQRVAEAIIKRNEYAKYMALCDAEIRRYETELGTL